MQLSLEVFKATHHGFPYILAKRPVQCHSATNLPLLLLSLSLTLFLTPHAEYGSKNELPAQNYNLPTLVLN